VHRNDAVLESAQPLAQQCLAHGPSMGAQVVREVGRQVLQARKSGRILDNP